MKFMEHIIKNRHSFSHLPFQQQRIEISKKIKEFVSNNSDTYKMEYLRSYSSEDYPDLIIFRKMRFLPDSWRQVFSLNSFLEEFKS
jgi:hypothetical protein